jgi:hypothetical protein
VSRIRLMNAHLVLTPWNSLKQSAEAETRKLIFQRANPFALPVGHGSKRAPFPLLQDGQGEDGLLSFSRERSYLYGRSGGRTCVTYPCDGV